MNDPTHIVLHCSGSRWGNAEIIDEWHANRGWEGIGYHWIVLGGFTRPGDYVAERADDGRIEPGRPEDEAGAHAPGLNSRSIGVCMIGKDGEHSFRQRVAALALVASLCLRYGVKVCHVLGHFETECEQSKAEAQRKTCPDIDMGLFRAELRPLITMMSREDV